MIERVYLLFVFALASIRGYNSECTMTAQDLDKCMLKLMFFGNRDSIVPVNDGEMDAHCKMMHDGNDCFAQYSATCLKDFPHDITKILTASMKRHMTERCDNPKDRKEFIEYVGCLLPKAEKFPPLQVCSDKHTKMIGLAVEMGQDGHIPGACCSFHLFKDCVLTTVEGICTKGHQQFWDEVLSDVANEAIAFACGELTTKEQCEKLHTPADYAKIKAVMDSNDPAVYKTEFLTPVKFFLDMVKKYHHELPHS